MADPLTLLREFTRNKRNVLLENDTFSFDDIKFPRNVETNFRSLKGEGEPYTLDAVWFMLQHAEQKYTDYIADCRKSSFPRVSLVDKRDLVSYLTGETEHCASIQRSTSFPQIPVLGSEASREREKDDLEERSAKKQRTEEAIDEGLKAQIQAEKEQVAKRLNAPKTKAAPAESMSIDLGSGPTGDKTNESKTKRSVVKRSSVKEEEGEDVPKEAPSAKSKFMEADVAITRDIVDRERVIRTRTSILQSNKKHFTNIINTVTACMKREELQKQADQKRKASTYDRYQEVQEDKFWKERLKGNEPEEFQIDTRGTFADSGRMPDVAQLSKPKPPVKPKSPKPAPSPSKHHADKNAVPIIIVPSALTSLITNFNTKEFLVDGVFVPSIEKKNSGAKKEASLVIERKRASTNTVLKYQVIDNVTKLSPKDWNRVIAVFALGAAWQFKGWLWSTPVELFSRVRGFYLHYEDEAVPETIKSWDVKILAVSKVKSKKHLAQTAAVEFWDAVDLHLHSKKQDQFDTIYY